MKQSGIYAIICTANGKMYIGSTKDFNKKKFLDNLIKE